MNVYQPYNPVKLSDKQVDQIAKAQLTRPKNIEGVQYPTPAKNTKNVKNKTNKK